MRFWNSKKQKFQTPMLDAFYRIEYWNPEFYSFKILEILCSFRECSFIKKQ